MKFRDACIASSLVLAFGCGGGDDSAETTSNTTPGDTGQTGDDDGVDDGVPTTGVPTTGDPTGDSDGTVDDTGEPPGSCLGGGGAAADGEGCTANADCASGVCTIFSDVPVNGDAVCEAAAADCSMRVTGTVFDLSTGMPVADAAVKVSAALQAATNPTGAAAVAMATAGADGRFDATTDGAVGEALGIVALTESAGFYLTSTGLAAPVMGLDYNVANSIHDVWVVPTGDLTAWSDELAMDAGVPAAALPLGDSGGVVGIVRDSTGAPIADAVIASTNDMSDAVIRYLNEDGTFNPDATTATGLFVIMEPSVPEDFEATVGGSVVGGGTAGSAANVVFTLIINAD